MKIRIISALVLLPLFIFILVKGGYYLAILTLVCSFIGINEFCNALKNYSSKTTKYLLFIMTFFQMLAVLKDKPEATIALIFFLLFLQGAMVVLEKINPFEAAISLFTFCYVSISISYVYLLSKEFPKFFWYIFIISMVTDTFAYFSGYFFGKHKLSPKLSPKKTIEGAIGGIIFCTFACFLYSYFYHNDVINIIIPFAIFGSIVSQIGDIFASAFKRQMNIKDYGHIIPGHGGILDRADSIIFTASYVYIVVIILNYN